MLWAVRRSTLSLTTSPNAVPGRSRLFELDRRGDDAAFWAGYDRLLSRFITPDLIQQGLDANFGTRTNIDLAFTTVLSSTTKGDTAVVSTHEAVREVVVADYQ